MKKFWTTLLRGFELILLGLLSTESFVSSGIIFANIHTQSGWFTILCLCAAVLSLALGVFFMWILGKIGNDYVEYSKAKEESK